MNNISQILFVGLGSHHGDDQIGWLVADRLATERDLPSSVAIRKAAIPLDLLDWLEGVDCLHVCDASQSAASSGKLQRWDWDNATKHAGPTHQRGKSLGDLAPALAHRAAVERNSTTLTELLHEITRQYSRGSHDFGLPAVLNLAARLHRLPKRIVIWAIAGDHFEPGRPVSFELNRALPTITTSILQELNHARDVPCAVAIATD